MSMSSPSSAAPSLPYQEALAAVRSELEAMKPEELVTINFPIPPTVVAVLGSMPELKSFREDIARELPRFEMKNLDNLDLYARAAGQAHAEYVLASAPSEPIAEMFEELTKIRALLYADVNVLAMRNLVDASKLKELKGPAGYKNVTFDVLALIALLRKSWAAVASKTGVSAADLDHAERLCHQLNLAVGLKEQGSAAKTEASETRLRAVSLFMNAFNQVRRALTYLRWDEGDLESILPALFNGRFKGASKAEVDEAVPPITPAPAQPSTNGGAVPTGSMTAASILNSDPLET